MEAVPNEEVAIQIAEVILESSFKIEPSSSNQYNVTYDKRKKTWTVLLPLPEESLGWECKLVIRKKDARIMEIILE
jgi:hypothetical protein